MTARLEHMDVDGESNSTDTDHPVIDVVVNCPTVENAHLIAETVIADRLAAAAHVLPAHETVYRWGGEVTTATEVEVRLRTTAEKADLVAARVAALHPFILPSITTRLVGVLNDEYRTWVAEQTTRPTT